MVKPCYSWYCHVHQLDLSGLIQFVLVPTHLKSGHKACQMPSGNFHYYLCAMLNAEATSRTRKLHCYWDILRLDKIPFETPFKYFWTHACLVFVQNTWATVTWWIRNIDTFMIRRANIQYSDWMEKGIWSGVRGSNQSFFRMQMSAGCEGSWE